MLSPDIPHQPRLDGLDPFAVTGVLASLDAQPPSIPGWRITNALGEGGLGVVWKANRIEDDAVGAIKIPKADDVTLIDRLEVEASALQALDHPHIVRLLESGPLDDGSLYLAMEYVDGPPLSQAIPAGGFPAVRAYAIFRQVAAAVAHAHSRGVLHRDLKPGNVLLDADGNARVVDFGLAHSAAGRVLRLSLTLTGLVAGTAEYLPPEAYQRGYEPAAAADIYSLGIILYELLTGHPPRGAWLAVSLQKRDVDIRVDDFLRCALNPDPAKRFRTVQSLLDELNHILSTPPRYAGTPRVTRAVRFMDFVWTVVGLFLLLGSFGILARVEKYGMGLPVDLVGNETTRIGTYQGIAILLAVAAPATLWQLVRLWRFRAVPMREALPSPFGVRLGSSRTAATAVALAQVLCVILPAIFGAQAWREKCMKWLEQGDPPWAQGFVVTEGINGTVPHDPWEWPGEGRKYSLREHNGWITSPLGYNLDHTNFIPGYVPRGIAGLTFLFIAGLVITFLSALHRWWRFRRWRQPVILLSGVLLITHVVRADMAAWQADANLREGNMVLTRVLFDHGCLTVRKVVSCIVSGTDPFPKFGAHFADSVRIGTELHSGPGAVLPALQKMAANCGQPYRHLTLLHEDWVPLGAFERFAVVQVYQDCLDGAGTPSTGALTIVGAYGDLVFNAEAAPPHVTIRRLDAVTAPLWVSEDRLLSAEAAVDWKTDFVSALSKPFLPGQADPLAPFFLTHLLSPDPGCQWEPDPAVSPLTRTDLLTALHSGTVAQRELRLLPSSASVENLPGARRRIELAFREGGDTAAWKADLVFTGGRWQCAQLITR